MYFKYRCDTSKQIKMLRIKIAATPKSLVSYTVVNREHILASRNRPALDSAKWPWINRYELLLAYTYKYTHQPRGYKIKTPLNNKQRVAFNPTGASYGIRRLHMMPLVHGRGKARRGRSAPLSLLPRRKRGQSVPRRALFARRSIFGERRSAARSQQPPQLSSSSSPRSTVWPRPRPPRRGPPLEKSAACPRRASLHHTQGVHSQC